MIEYIFLLTATLFTYGCLAAIAGGIYLAHQINKAGPRK